MEKTKERCLLTRTQNPYNFAVHGVPSLGRNLEIARVVSMIMIMIRDYLIGSIILKIIL